MVEIIGVRFRNLGRVYYFGPSNITFKKGEYVIVETARGVDYGMVVIENKEMNEEDLQQPLRDIIRKATDEDAVEHQNNLEKAKEAFKVCLEKIKKHELDMKLVECEYTFDRKKLLFYFTSDDRIDFRALVKDLAYIYKTRIEMRQIGTRDVTKLIGGIGVCGRQTCCSSCLEDFMPVSISMVKNQHLVLNPSKISGLCGRLMCCLHYEDEAYKELNKNLPGTGDIVTTADGLKGEVASTNVLKQLVKVVVELDNEEKEIREYKAADLRIKLRKQKKNKKDDEESMDDLKELEKLSGEDKDDHHIE